MIIKIFLLQPNDFIINYLNYNYKIISENQQRIL